jgi:carboxypeptidase family protein/TonB-dependent receptor-like protein
VVVLSTGDREGPVAASRAPIRAARVWWIAAAAAGLTALLTPAAIEAQKGTGAVAGIVKDSAGVVIPSVEVVVIKTGVTVRSDTRGRFIIAGVPVGTTDISFRRISFAPIILHFPVTEDDTVEATVTLGASTAQALPATVVDVPAEHQRRLDAFEAHRRTGAGHFITRDDIERRSPRRLTDLLRSVPGTSVGLDRNGMPILQFSGTPHGSNCVPAYFMDGLRVRTLNIDDIPPVDVEGIELYSGAAGLPPEYNQFIGSTAVCGTVVIWTRLPGNKSGAA